jgi:membrane protease subunit (stomatin/prohibitin family)
MWTSAGASARRVGSATRTMVGARRSAAQTAGANVETRQKDCENCGAANPAVANFCHNCGHPYGPGWVRPAVRLTPVVLRWRKLKYRMTRKEVRTLLGEPARIEAAPPDAPECERWLYEYAPAGKGTAPPNPEAAEHPTEQPTLRAEVRFLLADGALTGWTEPDWR